MRVGIHKVFIVAHPTHKFQFGRAHDSSWFRLPLVNENLLLCDVSKKVLANPGLIPPVTSK